MPLSILSMPINERSPWLLLRFLGAQAALFGLAVFWLAGLGWGWTWWLVLVMEAVVLGWGDDLIKRHVPRLALNAVIALKVVGKAQR